MSQPTVGFVGGGRIARIILTAWGRAKLPLSDVAVADIDAAVLSRLQTDFPAITVSQDNRQAASRDVVLFGLHPPVFPAVLGEISGSLSKTAVLVSLAPRWTMGKISAALGGFDRLARAIPNAPSVVGQGYNPVSFAGGLPADDRTRVHALFAPLGACPEVAEDTLEAYAILSAMGPTYLWFQLYQLAELGRGFGMTREAALEAVAAMTAGAASTMREAGLSPEAVMDLIPVKPLAPIEATVRESYASILGALHAKLKG